MSPWFFLMEIIFYILSFPCAIMDNDFILSSLSSLICLRYFKDFYQIHISYEVFFLIFCFPLILCYDLTRRKGVGEPSDFNEHIGPIQELSTIDILVMYYGLKSMTIAQIYLIEKISCIETKKYAWQVIKAKMTYKGVHIKINMSLVIQ